MLSKKYILERLEGYIDPKNTRIVFLNGGDSISKNVVDKMKDICLSIYDYLTPNMKNNTELYPLNNDGVQIEMCLTDNNVYETYYHLEVFNDYIEINIIAYDDTTAIDSSKYHKIMYYDDFDIEEVFKSLEIIEPKIKIIRRKEKIAKILDN